MARPFYQLAKGRLRSWNPVMFGLLVTDSLFVAATALLIVVLGTREFGRYAVSLVASLLYLLNFAVSNLRVTGEVDAAEGFFLFALLWSLSELRLWVLPLIAILGALSKETFVPFSTVFMAAWWLVARETLPSQVRSLIWIITSAAASLATTTALQWWVVGHFVSPVEFAAGSPRESRLSAALYVLAAGPELLVHILVVAAAGHSKLESISEIVVDPNCGGIGGSLRSRRILRRRTGHGRQGAVQRSGASFIHVGGGDSAQSEGSECLKLTGAARVPIPESIPRAGKLYDQIGVLVL
jgi:hypothetical protein